LRADRTSPVDRAMHPGSYAFGAFPYWRMPIGLDAAR
jgi:hypothetical protein